MAANRVVAINPPIDDTGPIRKFSADPGSRTDLQNPAKVSPRGKPIRNFIRSGKLQNESSRISRYFVPSFAPNFAPNFPRIFRGLFALRFVGDGDQKKITKNPRHFSMQNSQANTKKTFTKFFWKVHKVKFHYRRHIVDTDTIADAVFVDAVSETFLLCSGRN